MTRTAFHAAVTGSLSARSPDLSRRWEELLREASRSRGRPSAPAEAPAPTVLPMVRWLVQPPSAGFELPPHVAADVGEHVLARRGGGQLLEELLLDVRRLEEVIFDALAEEVEARQGAVPPAAVAEFARALACRVGVLMTVTAGIFNEEAVGERRAERRKLDDFARMVSHEMRTPIGAAYTASRLLQDLRDELPRRERQQMLEVVGRGLSRATHLLDSLMSITIARTGGEEGESRRGLRSVVEDVLGQVGEVAEGAGVRLELATPVPQAAVEGRRVELILVNLLSNAIKYADGSKAERWVRLRVERDRDRFGWRLQVADNGIGIPRGEQEKVFRRFYRAHTDLAEGNGLGLVIAREAAEQLGGDLLLESVPGIGSTFSFSVPDLEEAGLSEERMVGD